MIRMSFLGLLLLLLTVEAANNCANPPLIIPDTFLDNIFDTVFQVNKYQDELRNFITNPNMDTARTYITTQSSYLITLWVFAGLSFAAFIAFVIQLCCFNCCSNRKCGRKMALNSYTPSSVSCSVYLFMFFSFLLIAITIASFIIASDLFANLSDTTCDITATFNYLFDGTPAGYTPQWSGADNFNFYAQNLSINFPNTMPTLNNIFQSTQYTQLVSTASGSLYTAATTYNCNTNLATQTVGCPFSTTSSCPNNGSTTQIPVFSNNFCIANISTSSAALIQSEENTNTTLWKNSLVSLQQNISQIISNPINFSNLVSQTSTLSGSIVNLKPGLASGIDAVNAHFFQSKIGSYITFSIIIGIGLISFLASCCVFCTRNFNCRYLFYPLWILFTLLSIIFFLASSVLLFGAFTTFGSCLSYTYYTTTPGAFQTISFYSSSQITQILNSCFITSPTGNIFNTFNQTNLPSVEQIKSSYYSALPSSTFTTVVNNITNTLGGYAINPNTVMLVGATTGQNPQDALNQLNQIAQGSSFCGVSGSTFQYNPIKCNPNLIDQSNAPSCYIISNNNSAANSLNCTANEYQALLTYGNNIQSLTSSYINDANLQNYRNAYFNYYQSLSTFMNNYVQALFTSFLQPYQNLLAGSSCSFLTDSLNSLIYTSCNRDFPEIYAISVLVTAMACCFFFMMILAYFLTTRFEFYAFLNGDLSNYNEDVTDTEQQDPTVQIEMADMTGRTTTNRKELLTPKR